MARRGLVWTVPPAVIAVSIRARGPGIRVRLAKRLQAEAAAIQADMKANAPWTDRTGQARAGLSARAQVTATEGVITLSHGADHGIWLEIANQGRFAIVGPTLATGGARGMANLVDLL